MKTPLWKTILIFSVCLIGVFFALPNFFTNKVSLLPEEKIHFGLDLRGGSYLLLKVDFDVYLKDQLEINSDVLRRELRKNQVTYSNLSNNSKEISLYLRNNNDAEKIATIVKAVNKDLSYQYLPENKDQVILYFSQNKLEQLQSDLVEQAREIIRMRVDESGTKEPSIQKQGKFNILLQVPGLQDPTELKNILGKTAKMTFHLVDESASSEQILNNNLPIGTRLIESEDGSGHKLAIKTKSVLSGELLSDAKASLNSGTPAVSFTLNNIGAKLFADITKHNSGKRLAIVMDNKLLSAPMINEPIVGGSGIISGHFTINSANELALLLRAGALPAPIEIIEERTVGPNLGEDSIEAGTIASIISIVAIVIFMIIMYGMHGVFASIALFFNLIFIIAVMTLIQATLTLPGIAGIVLTMGMAVDANVLIFERIQEELSHKASQAYAINQGFAQAFATILDSNLTVLLAAFFLYEFGSGVVKGFAVTLAIGITTSMFTAVSLTRLLIDMWENKFHINRR